MGKEGRPHMPTVPRQANYRACTELVQSSALTRAIQWRHNRVLQELVSVISTAKGEIHPSSTSSTVFTIEGGVKKWHGGSIPINTHRKGLLDGCDDWVVSADLPEWERHPDVIRKTALRPDIVIHSASTQQIIMVELTVPYESRMEEAHAFKEGKYLDLTKELKKDGYEAKVMPVEIGAREFVGSSAYGLLSKLSIGGNRRTKALRLLAETAENSSRWIWSRRNESLNTGTIQFEFFKITGVTQSSGTHQRTTTPPSLSINGEKVSVFEQSKQKNVIDAIKEVKNLLESITSTTTKDLSTIADIFQQIDVSEQTLSPSSVQDALDVVSLISDLPEEDDDLVSSETRANSSNRPSSRDVCPLIPSLHQQGCVVSLYPIPKPPMIPLPSEVLDPALMAYIPSITTSLADPHPQH
ncbi:reverse transcriptase [Plakobranchus ocellatus]|uniref:Reverse transcriptase n=1 Tax=Plakobranchus ocellatus TaxID=259542 RepID=A0AAV4B9Z0_9GAST|nr:reverse transcriptase [Plakobranchus ocellatus]